MIEAEFVECAAQFHALGARLAAAIGSDTAGRLAVDALPDVLAAVRQGELASCRLIERADRTGEYGADGAASTAAFVRQVSGERSQWAARRVALGRALADRMPATLKGWQAGDLGLDHADVILRATKNLSDPQLAAGVETFLADQAPQLTPTQLAAAADHLLASAAPDETDAETARKYAAQHVNLSQTIGGMWRLDGWLDPEAGLILSRALAAFTRKPDPDAGDLLFRIDRAPARGSTRPAVPARVRPRRELQRRGRQPAQHHRRDRPPAPARRARCRRDRRWCNPPGRSSPPDRV